MCVVMLLIVFIWSGVGGGEVTRSCFQLLVKPKFISLLFPPLLLLSWSTGPPHDRGQVNPAPYRATDQLGRVVEFEVLPQRIISLAPSNTEILFALGLGDRVMGVSDFCDYPPEAMQRERVGTFVAPNVEKIISLHPDLILAAPIHQKMVIPTLEKHHLKVVVLAPNTLEEVLQAITLVGRVTGRQHQAAQLVERLKRRMEAITRVTSGLSRRPRVLYLTWHDPLWTSGSGTLAHDLIQKAGGNNIASDLIGWRVIDLETVIARNPQVIIACTGHGQAKTLPFEWAKNDPRLACTEARKRNRVYLIDANLVTRPGPRVFKALEQFARFIHPELFGYLPADREKKSVLAPRPRGSIEQD